MTQIPHTPRLLTWGFAGALLLYGHGAGAFPRAPSEAPTRIAQGVGSVRKFTIPEHDLFPESIAHDPASGDFFLGSMSQARILRIRPDGTYEDFLTSPVPELESSIGMKADGLYYHDGSLIMVQPRSNQVVRLALNDAHAAVEGFDVLVGDTLVFVASSYADTPRRDGAETQHGDIFIHQVPLQ